MGKLILVGLLAFAVALAGTAYAEVQNIKVSGDIDMKAFTHNNYDLQVTQKNRQPGKGPGGDGAGDAADTFDDDANLILSTVRLKVDADLTDNVSTSVRLLNQRFWDTDVDATNNVDINHAYVVLKEFLYSPLTVIAGKQDLNYGTGFVVGPGLLGDPNGMFGGAAVDVNGIGAEQTQIAQEHSAYNSYDAVRFILDYAPITVEGLYAKINETATGPGDLDQTLFGFLVNYKLDQWNAEVEPYWFYKHDDDTVADVTVNDAFENGALRDYESNRVHTIGLRLAGSPMENLQLNGEGAFQTGEMTDEPSAGLMQQDRDRQAWGANVDIRYNWVQVPWTPATGIGWVFYSGEDSPSASNLTDQSDDFNAWDPMYRGSFQTYIQDFLTGRDAPTGLYVTRDPNDTAATTNRHLLYFDVGAKPLEDVNLWARYTHAWFDEAPLKGRDTSVGDEVDVKATYDYTEDVQLNMFGGWFFPGSYYDEAAPNSRGNDLAWTLGGGGSVKF